MDLKLLNEKKTIDINFSKDNFLFPDETITRNAFKSRILSFEYYINNLVNDPINKVKQN